MPILTLAVTLLSSAFAQNARLPEDVSLEPASIISEGIRMAADKFHLKANAGKSLRLVRPSSEELI